MSSPPNPVGSGASVQDPAVRKHLRGSSLLLIGKVLAIGLNFLAQVLLVRYLVQADYGAFAYALSVVTFFNHLSTMGLRIGVPRYVPVYHEQKQHARLTAAVVFSFAATALCSTAIVAAVLAAPEGVAALIKDSRHPLALLLILVFLVPVEAFDNLLVALFASFSRSRSIFIRRYVLGPGLRLGAVITVMALHGSAHTLAIAYVAAGVIGLTVYAPLLLAMLRQYGVAKGLSWYEFRRSARELCAFSIPLWGTDLLAGTGSFVTMALLGYFRGLEEVALFAAVVPISNLNRVVRMSFETLFAPTAARLYLRNDSQALNQLYWKTATWMTVLSFPVFALSFSASRPLVGFLYGSQYESAWLVLSILSLGQFFNTATGFNNVMLQVGQRVRTQVVIDLGAAALLITLNLVLIPLYGALGAAMANLATHVAHNLVKQFVMQMATGVSVFDRHHAPTYTLAGVLAATALVLCANPASSHIAVAAPVVAAFALLPLIASRQRLHIADTFPELARIPLARYLVT